MTTGYTYIYGLKVKNTNEIRYIGKSNNPLKRLKKHICESKFKKTHKDCWIYSVLKSGQSVDLEIIEKVKISKWAEREIYWIELFSVERNLVNHCRGGKGGRPIKYKITYEECKSWVNNNLPKIKSSVEWNNYIKNNTLPDCISKFPKDTYENRGWKGWGNFLNSRNKSYNYINHFSYDECKKYLKKFNLKNGKEFKKKISLFDKKVPLKPDRYYYNKNCWKGWRDFLNSKSIKKNYKNYLNYKEAKKYISNNYNIILTVNKWREVNFLKNLPDFIPNKPDRYYKKTNEWISWGDFLGTNSIQPNKIVFRKYRESLEFVNKLNIKNNKEWRIYCKSGNKPLDIPSSPDRVYSEWENWKIWLRN